jgi:HD-like signal output (HDOD) protein
MALMTVRPLSREESPLKLEELPRLSPLVVRLIRLLANPDCRVADVVSVIEQDVLLSAQVLKRANSAVFGRLQPIRSVQHAVRTLGVGTMRRFALGSSLSNLFFREKTAPSFSMGRFNLHSLATGTLSEILADELPTNHKAGAFVAGLLHDVGKLLMAIHLPKTYEDVLAFSTVAGTSQIESERQLLGTDHAEFSAQAISRWELDDSIRIAAKYHHQPDHAKVEEPPVPGTVGLATIVHKANLFVNYLGMSVLPATVLLPDPPVLEISGFVYPARRVEERFKLEWTTLWKLLQ